MSDTQPPRHTAISVLMAILLTAVSTTATPRQSPRSADQGGQGGDGAREEGLRRGADSPQGPQGVGHPLPPPLPALLTTQKRSSVCSEESPELVVLQIKTGDLDWAGTDGDVQIRIGGPTLYSKSKFIDKPDVDDFERGDNRMYLVCYEDVGNEIVHVKVKLHIRDLETDWFLDWIKVYYKNKCGNFRFSRWLDKTDWFEGTDPLAC